MDVIVVNSAGCGSAMKEYERLFAGWRRGGGGAGRAALVGRAACVDRSATRVPRRLSGRSRSGARSRCGRPTTTPATSGTRSGSPPRRARCCARIPGLELVELRDAGVCCGSAGVYNLLQPEAARELGSRKADSVSASGASLLISANPGCTLQISAALAAQGVTHADRAHRRGARRLDQRRAARLTRRGTGSPGYAAEMVSDGGGRAALWRLP